MEARIRGPDYFPEIPVDYGLGPERAWGHGANVVQCRQTKRRAFYSASGIGARPERFPGPSTARCVEPIGLSCPGLVRTRLLPSSAFQRLFHAALVAFALLVAGSRAHAAVPMCSEDGRTVAAPPIMRPSSGRVLESRGDCERLRALLTGSNHGSDGRGSPLQASDAPLRAVPARAVVPTAPRLERLAVPIDRVGARPAATDDVFRPPRRADARMA